MYRVEDFWDNKLNHIPEFKKLMEDYQAKLASEPCSQCKQRRIRREFSETFKAICASLPLNTSSAS